MICVLPFLLFSGFLWENKNYCIKKNYTSRAHYTHYDDRECKDEYQDEVYATAAEIVYENGFKNIFDVGCGSGYKLVKYFDGLDTLGCEIQPTFDFLLHAYPHKKWMLSDFSCPYPARERDLIICSDVIEHLIDPDLLLNWIDQIDFKYLVISTPDRDKLPLAGQSGPPINPAHIREWSFAEFEEYLSRYFHIVRHFHHERSGDGQIIIATKRS